MNGQEEIKSLPLFGIPRLLPYIRKYIPKIVFMILLGFISSLIDSASPLFNR